MNVSLFSCSSLSQVLLELNISLPKLDASLYYFTGFLTLSQPLLVGIHLPIKVQTRFCTWCFPLKATGTYSRVLNWNLWNHWNLFPGASSKSQVLVLEMELHMELPLQLLQSLSLPTFSSLREGIMSLNTCSDGANQHSPWDWSRWHHVGERKHDRGHCYSALHKDRKGLRVHNRTRNFFFFLPLPLMFIDLSSSQGASLNVLLSCFCFVAWVQKRILQIDLSSLPLLGNKLLLR